MESSRDLTLSEYAEPVYYCRDCHSLHILDAGTANEDWDGCYCGKCGSTDIGQCAFGEWLEAEEEKKRREVGLEWSR